MRSYPGDRESVRSGRRSRRGDESSSGYSDNERKYRRSVSKCEFSLLVVIGFLNVGSENLVLHHDQDNILQLSRCAVLLYIYIHTFRLS